MAKIKSEIGVVTNSVDLDNYDDSLYNWWEDETVLSDYEETDRRDEE